MSESEVQNYLYVVSRPLSHPVLTSEIGVDKKVLCGRKFSGAHCGAQVCII